MGKNLVEKIIGEHLTEGELRPEAEIGLAIDQTLTQDATGTMAYLQWEAMGVERVRTELSVSYVDHNTLQMGFRNPDDHRYLHSVARRSGIVFSPAGTGICHQLHLENFAAPGKTLLGSDSHTPTAGGVGSLAIGAGGLSVALAMAGEPYPMKMPRVVKVELQGRLQGWASAKDVILRLLGELSVKGGLGTVFEYGGPGAASLSVPERATITNMGAELGATSSVFPSDEQTERFLQAMHRPGDFRPLQADQEADYDRIISLDLSTVEPMAACPHMPDKAVPVRELDGLAVDQVAIGSCTNSSYADLSLAARILQGRKVARTTDVLLAPGSKQVLLLLSRDGALQHLLEAGTRLLECACGPCIGMGGSPVSGGVSLRTFNRNFEGRSGTQDAQVYLVSPVTAAQAALTGTMTDPAGWGEPMAQPDLPEQAPDIRELFVYPSEDGSDVQVERGPNIVPLEQFPGLPDEAGLPVLLRVGDNVTTDHILPGGAEVTALRSNVPAISRYVYSRVDPGFAERCDRHGQGIIVAGDNYGQGSSREHAALAPRHLGVLVVLAKSFARIHRSNLINFGILPLLFHDPSDYQRLEQDLTLNIPLASGRPGQPLRLVCPEQNLEIVADNDLTQQEWNTVKAGGMLNVVRNKRRK
jgi:aconitate hydratase